MTLRHECSVTSLIAEGWLTPLALFGAGLAIQRDGELWLGLLHGIWKRISMETFRVLVDVTFVLSVLNAAVTPTSLARQLHDERVAGEVKANT